MADRRRATTREPSAAPVEVSFAPGRQAWIPLPTEGGHVTFAPTDEREQNLLRHFRNRYGRVSVERILSGQGLLDLYLAHCSLKGAPPRLESPAEVTEAAAGGDPVAHDTLLRFLKILGDVCGDAALTMGARGGVALCGGILPRLLQWLPESRFLEAFTDKGRMGAYRALDGPAGRRRGPAQSRGRMTPEEIA